MSDKPRNPEQVVEKRRRKAHNKTPREPHGVCDAHKPVEEIAESVFLKIRKLPHVPVNVYVRMGEVYVLSQAYRVTPLWDAMYPESFAGSFTRMERPHQIVRKLERVLDETESV